MGEEEEGEDEKEEEEDAHRDCGGFRGRGVRRVIAVSRHHTYR
jgi:hypothetical protein